MIDLHSARCSYWRHGHLRSYQEIWQDIRSMLAHTYQAVISGAELEDNLLTVQVFGTDVARFEIK